MRSATSNLRNHIMAHRNEGLRGFYKGMGINIIRVLPGTCVTFGVYEAVSKVLRLSGNDS